MSRGERGQATVELVALLPLLLAIAFGVTQVLAAGAARELAGTAAEAGAVALMQGKDPVAAARDALPGWSRDRLRVKVEGKAVHVEVEPVSLVPRLARAMTAHSVARTGT